MSTVKIAISLNEEIFKKTDELAKQLNKSRSQLISEALSKMFVEIDNKNLLSRINESCEDYSTEEKEYSQKMKKYNKRRLKPGED